MSVLPCFENLSIQVRKVTLFSWNFKIYLLFSECGMIENKEYFFVYSLFSICNSYHSLSVSAKGIPSLNSIDACVPSQNGLLEDCPHRHKVTRFLISSLVPSALSMRIPPFTQIGPLTFIPGSSIIPIEGSKGGSKTFSFSLSHNTKRPAGQWPASWRTISFSS